MTHQEQAAYALAVAIGDAVAANIKGAGDGFAVTVLTDVIAATIIHRYAGPDDREAARQVVTEYLGRLLESADGAAS